MRVIGYGLATLILLLSPGVRAEPMPVSVTEPTGQSGTLARTCFYYCACKGATVCTCTNWIQAGSPHCIASDDGNGGDGLNHSWNIPIYEADLPVTVRYTATTVNTSGNETTKGTVIQVHTFSP